MTATEIDAGDELPLTIPVLLRARASERGDAPLLVCDDETLSYRDALARSEELARGLVAVGAGKGTHVGLLQPNGADFVIGWLAAARIGAVTVPLSTFSTADELLTLLRGADIEILLSAARYRAHDYRAVLEAAIPSLPSSEVPFLRRIAFLGSDADLLAGAKSIEPQIVAAMEDGVTAADRLVIVHTSGSTSAPKGVIHGHGALIRHLDNLNQIRRFGPGEILFSNSPFFWIGGFAYALLGTLVAGAQLVCSNAADAAGVLDVIERTRPTMVNGFAASVAHLARDSSFPGRDLSSITRGNLYPIMPASARPADPELRHAMLGMTETGSVCLVSDDESDQPERRRGSFGRPAPGFEALVVDPDSGRRCGPYELGELWFRGPFMMEGYYGRERAEVFDADGWYHSGDLAHVDEDGFFYFKGRHGDMIKTAGANVSPREVEGAINDATGLAAHVLGLADPDRGQVVAAAVVAPGPDAVDIAALESELAKRLSAYKRPRRIIVIPAAPMLSSGKLDTHSLRALFDAT